MKKSTRKPPRFWRVEGTGKRGGQFRMKVNAPDYAAAVAQAKRYSPGCDIDTVVLLDSSFRENPATRYDSRNLEDARDLYERFTGHKGKTLLTVRKPVIPDEGLVIGKILGIMYETVRDGRREKYRHMFARKSRPLFVVSHDGKQLLMLGGAYDFTERGIVDRK